MNIEKLKIEGVEESDDHDCHLETSGEGHCEHKSHEQI